MVVVFVAGINCLLMLFQLGYYIMPMAIRITRWMVVREKKVYRSFLQDYYICSNNIPTSGTLTMHYTQVC